MSINTVIWVPFENHDLAQVKSASYLMSLAKSGAQATNFTCESIHPSLPNYMHLFLGKLPSFGTVDCNGCMDSSQSLIDLLETAGVSWGFFCEGLESTKPPMDYNVTFRSAAAGEYDNHHVPVVHLSNVMNNPARKAKIQDLSKLDLTNLPRFTAIVPNVKHEMHSGTVAAGDAWAKANIPAYIAAADLVIVWFDEGKGPLYLVFAGKGAKAGATSNVPYGNANLLVTLEDIFGLGRLGTEDAKAAAMTELLA
jgi:phosphatidylinositol-3-phosphatase